MALNLDQKKLVVAEVAEVASQALSVVAADYRGLTVLEMNELRSRARNSGVYLRVVRNTLARIAVEGTEFECVKGALVGSLVLAFSREAPGAAARLVRDYIKENNKLEVKLLSISGKLLDATELEAIAKLPTKEEAIATLMSVMQAPIEKFVRTLVEPNAKMVRTLAAVGDQKKSA